MMRYIRAFIKALQMTIRGETITPPAPTIPDYYQPLEGWVHSGLQKLALIITTADKSGLTQEQRQNIQLKLDGRLTHFEQTLQMVRHNMTTEYPKLMELDDAYTMMVIQSSNMNDQYRISQFIASDQITAPEVIQALEVLNEHLMSLPNIDRSEADPAS